MIYDILEVFKKEYEEKGDKLILDNYQLKDGLYVKVFDDGSLEYFIKSSRKVKINGKNKTEHDFKDLDGNIQKDENEWFIKADYISSIINTDKAIKQIKKIHSNNYYALFIKADNFIKDDSFINEAKREYFNALKNLENEKNTLDDFIKEITDKKRLEDIDKISNLIMNSQNDILKVAKLVFKDVSKAVLAKNYVKIFYYDFNLLSIEKEANYYFHLKIFNKNKYNFILNDELLGQSNANSGINQKKTFDEHLTKKKKQPFLIQYKTAFEIKKFFDWLKWKSSEIKDFENIFMHKYSKHDEAIIDNFDYLPLKIEKLQESIIVKNYLQIKNIEDHEINELWQLENAVDEIFYNKQLKHNYFRDDLKVSDFVSKKLQQLIFETKYAMVNYFKKYDEREFYSVVKKFGTDFIIEHLRQNHEYKARESLNLKFSLLQHKGEKIMDIKNMEEKIMKKLETSNYESLNNEEFFYLCGQVASYLLSKKNQHEKMHDLVEPFLRANNAQKLKKEIEFTFFQYKHAIHFGAKRINNALALIGAYEGEEKLSFFMDSFLVGYLSNTYIFTSKEEN